MSRPTGTAPRPGVVRYLVLPDHAGLRLDQGAAALTGLPRRRVRALAADGCLWLNGKAVRIVSRQLQLADVVDVVHDGNALAEPPPIPQPLAIVHEDGWLVAIDRGVNLTERLWLTNGPAFRKPSAAGPECYEFVGGASATLGSGL